MMVLYFLQHFIQMENQQDGRKSRQQMFKEEIMMGFIEEIAPHAQRVQKEKNILASLIIAQGVLESNWGRSGLATKGKNLFGIKGTGNDGSITLPTTEHINGKDV
ncbi:glucosaminidase domain-containing protein, partial [Bacillus licheniformis]|uniref:glucosaminidase domain-containing protein n=1 Tax=Bacillus licheniformis TaxID=1402 RepID=UPI003BFA7309